MFLKTKPGTAYGAYTNLGCLTPPPQKKNFFVKAFNRQGVSSKTIKSMPNFIAILCVFVPRPPKVTAPPPPLRRVKKIIFVL